MGGVASEEIPIWVVASEEIPIWVIASEEIPIWMVASQEIPIWVRCVPFGGLRFLFFLRRSFLQNPSGFAFFSPFLFKIRAVFAFFSPSCSQSERFSFLGAPNAPQRRIRHPQPTPRRVPRRPKHPPSPPPPVSARLGCASERCLVHLPTACGRGIARFFKPSQRKKQKKNRLDLT